MSFNKTINFHFSAFVIMKLKGSFMCGTYLHLTHGFITMSITLNENIHIFKGK